MASLAAVGAVQSAPSGAVKTPTRPLERLVPEARSAEGQTLRAQRSSPFPRRARAPRERYFHRRLLFGVLWKMWFGRF